jgi:hypothetical protein
MLADRALGRRSPIRPLRPAPLLPPTAAPADPAERTAVGAYLRPSDAISGAPNGHPVQPMPRAPVAHDAHTVAADSSAQVGAADLSRFPEAPVHEAVPPASVGEAGKRALTEADRGAPDATPPVAEPVVAPPMRVRVATPAPAADAMARHDRTHAARPAAIGFDAAPDAASSTYIHIGRVELHAAPASPLPQRTTARPAHQPMPLEEYLRRRKGTPR